MLPVCCLQLPGSIIKKLLDAGFTYVEDLFSASHDLQPEVEHILNPYPELKKIVTESLTSPQKTSAEELLMREEKCPRILSFSYRLDKLLGGGIPLGSVIEVCGAPGSGKTQLCLQLCISVQLHASLEGLQAEAIYIDTDAGYSPERMREIGRGCKEHCCKVARANGFSKVLIETLEHQSFTDYYYMSVSDYSQLLAVVLSLDEFIRSHGKVKLVIIDSLTFPFLQQTDMLRRTTYLCKVLNHLNMLAAHYNLSVVVTNHLTTRISHGEDQLIPALGECLGHLMKHRLMLGFLPISTHFAIVIFKSPVFPHDSAEFQIVGDGIRDIQ